MFSAIYYTKTEQRDNEFISRLPITENRIEKTLTGSFSIAIFLGRWLKNYAFFLDHIALSQPMHKIMSQNSAHRLISIL